MEKKEYKISDLDKAEMKLYRFLGVKKFQSFVFTLERWKHYRDKRQNSNYHFYRLNMESISKHYAFLSYNALIHFIGLFLTLLVIMARRVLSLCWGIPDVGMLFAAFINFYCILLQRYNALRIRCFEASFFVMSQKRKVKNAKIMASKCPYALDEKLLCSDMILMEKLKKALLEERDFVIGEEQAAALCRLAEWAEYAGILSKRITTNADFYRRKRDSRLYTGAEKNTASLQKIFGSSKRQLLHPFSIITMGKNCEKAFSRLFRDNTSLEIIEKIETFQLAAKKRFVRCEEIRFTQNSK